MIDQRQLLRLLSQAADGLASDAQHQQIAQALAADAQLRDCYVRFAQTEAALGHSAPARLAAVEFPQPHEPSAELARVAQSSPARIALWTIQSSLQGTVARLRAVRIHSWGRYALAASLALAAFFAVRQWSSCARIVSADDVAWGPSFHFSVGDSLSRQWIELQSGSAIIGFQSAAMLEVAGPARLRVTGPNSCRLEYGRIVALAPPLAHGFQLAAPDFTVTDLGTSFRVDAPRTGRSTLQVLEGVVEATSRVSGLTKRYTAGAVAAAAPGLALEAQDIHRYVPQTSNRVAYRSKHVPSLGRDGLKRNDRCFLFLESVHYRLPHDVAFNASAVGSHDSFTGAEGSALSGAVVDSYLLHCAPFGGENVVQGAITFPEEILGVIASSDKLNATDEIFGSPWSLTCREADRGLESAGEVAADSLEISLDRRTLRFAVRTSAIDQLRVIVRSPAQ